MQALLLIAGVSLSLGLPLEAPRNFTNYKLVSAKVASEQLLNVAQKLERQGLLEIWSDTPRQDGAILFSVAPEYFDEVRLTMKKSKISTKVENDNIQVLIDRERATSIYSGYADRPISLKQFESYDQILDSLKYYAKSSSNFYTFVVGKTYEGRDIVGIRIASSNESKPIVFMECGIHAREWASTSTCLFILNQLATQGQKHKDLLNKFEFHIVPSTNPDGYEYTRNVNRLWRKNRKPGPKPSRCYGVDLNRNFKAGSHCGVGTSTDPCAEIYCGTAPFSEPETAAIRDHMQTLKGKVEYYVSLHTYGLMWMFPYSYKTQKCADYDELFRRGKLGVNAIKAKTGTNFRFGPIATTIYAVTGSTIDWTYESLGIKKSYVLELQPSSWDSNGFVLDPKDIIFVGDETFTGLKALWLS